MKDFTVAKALYVAAFACFVVGAALFYFDADIAQRHLFALGFVGLACMAAAPLAG